MASPVRRRLPLRPRRLLLLLSGLLVPLCGAFNLDVDSPAEYSGPEGSYFGFAVDFFVPSASNRMFLLVGAPKANTTQPGIVEGGQVLKCDWSSSRRCQPIEFDATGNRDYAKDDPLEFKSHQWFGASVRSKQDKILACAPLYHWRTELKQEREPVGTCFLQDGTKTVEYAPCRSKNIDADGQGFCQGGFSIDFTKADRVLLGGPGSFYWQGYSVAVGDFNGDGIDDFVSGVPRAARTLGMVYIYDGKNMSSLHNFTGEQMAAYFGFSVAATDINGDDYADVFIGAPLFMDRGSDGKLQEVGQVTVSLQRASGEFQTTKLNGFEVFARFGSAIAPLGDLDQDGFNDIAIAAPYGGEDKKGIVYIFNGRSTGLNTVPSQILEGQWASQNMPPSFGYSMKGATDIDKNGYPDLIVGAFGVDRAVLYSFNVRFCLKADGKGALPRKLNFQVELLLDKLKQKGAIRRALFLHNRSPGHSKNMTISRGGQMQCEELIAYLRDESEFRDKLTPITIFMEYRLDYRTAADATGLRPILNQFTPANISRQAHILLDCGEDNVCKPKLEVSVDSDQKKIYIGDDNPLTLIVKAQNQGEGAYEAELIISMPPQADFIGVVRNSEALARLSCAFKTENQTRQVVCDLGNPMKAGTQLLAGLRFSVHQQSEMDTSVKFDLQIQSSNLFDKLRNNGPSSFSKAMLNLQWPYKYNNNTLLYILHFDIDGPMNCTSDMEINPLRIKISSLQTTEKNDTVAGQGDRNHLITKRDLALSEGDVHTLGCGIAQCLRIVCQVGRLDRGKSAILYVKSLLWTETFMNVTTNVTWGIQPAPMPVPVWVIILAVLAGLLLLAVLVFVMYRMGFFKRVRPPQEEQEREQLQPHENGEGNSET
ncbi:Integrin alpha-V [Sciurus carolinensis]|uniref:Integrin alpha-V n=1 Tax=Sciurus carolinensis TaxID=30640 RepID=A0AA41NJS7_SCICA|nr:Integrin alpha-V [Sciurus carolinensis]